jgi:hypothetical protein
VPKGYNITPSPVLTCRVMLVCFVSYSLSQVDMHSVAIMTLSSDVFTPNSMGSMEQAREMGERTKRSERGIA